ncbi:tRNA (adenosine(37)-N6)-threonylcarbamoyltransferase complex ATPase subunit type 1 TsaE [Derxia gummosa]|uniref:tRNA threonylcarbamoyladenosine biosynthesis protein TsaE n=1 Tax=Derxia gummosa DSM 723 TaxID=1121388 RepID=A0A8B6X7H9_9BURK|nr:tRNA (adenosine(37)-N6)-threonylcarbamoyltransferase complex ATPase subunit type 1 TsaE [Derxia gummosa]
MNAPLATLAIELPDAAATDALGARFAAVLRAPLHLQLHGDLGAGKTSFIRATLRALGHTGPVRSPTYAIVEGYSLAPALRASENDSRIAFYHFDFYRFNRDEDWLDAGLRDHFADNAVCAVEWPEQAGELLPPPDLALHLDYAGDGRHARLDAFSERGRECLNALASPAAA